MISISKTFCNVELCTILQTTGLHLAVREVFGALNLKAALVDEQSSTAQMV
ncbi:hypothetical protein [Methanolobus sp. WCC5]|uniref:hypothetical protein n=1 Tax=Methanolobus sp. WCC5 TaxID=3125785 RepID=UPI00324F73C6